MNVRKFIFLLGAGVQVASGFLALDSSQASVHGVDRPPRIESIYFDHGKVEKLYLYPGRTTLLDFPCDVTRAIGGPAGDIQWIVGATEKSELDVWLKAGSAQPTNLTVRCNKQVFVFDVIPSRASHQEYVEIAGSYGGAELQGAKEVQSSKSAPPKSEEYLGKKLIASSERVDPSKNSRQVIAKEASELLKVKATKK
jgi:hypothetical protein